MKEIGEIKAEVKRPTHEKLGTELLVLAGVIAGSSEGRVRVVVNEEDATDDYQEEAAHFLKLDGARLGRDLELYELMGKYGGQAYALAGFLGEVVLPLKTNVRSSYDAAAPLLEKLGHSLIAEEHHEEWSNLFRD